MPYKRGKNWMAQVRLDGKKHRKSFATKAEAIAWEVQQRENLYSSPRVQKIQTVKTVTACLLEWAEKYLDFAKIKFSRKTYEEKQHMFKLLFRSINPDSPLSVLTPGVVLSFLQAQAQTRSGYAANKDRKNLVAAWNWGIKYMGLPAPNPCLVDRFPEQRQVRYVPPESDFWKAFEQAESEQDAVMLLAYLHLGARKSELFVLRWEDVDFSESKIRLYTRKRRDGSLEYDWLPLTDDLYESLIDLRQTAQSEWIFPDPKTNLPYISRHKWLITLCAKANVKRFGLHAVRHLTASILAKANVPMIDIQTILRHKNLATTERYIRRLETIRPALRVLPGRKKPTVGEKAHKKRLARVS